MMKKQGDNKPPENPAPLHTPQGREIGAVMLYRMYIGHNYGGNKTHEPSHVGQIIRKAFRAVGVEGYTVLNGAVGDWMGKPENTTIVEQYGAAPEQIKTAARIIADHLQQDCVLVASFECGTYFVGGEQL